MERFLIFLLFLLIFPSGCGFHLVLSQPKIGKIELCDQSGCSKTEYDPKSNYFLNINMKNAPFGTIITTHWYYIENSQNILIRERVSDLEKNRLTIHTVKIPRVGYWKQGTYKIVVKVNKSAVKTLHFKVKEIIKVKKRLKPIKKNPPEKTKEKDLLDDDF
jgi:hypothetical protein